MCNHENEIIIETTGKYFIYMCKECGLKRKEMKQQPKKKTLLDRILRR